MINKSIHIKQLSAKLKFFSLLNQIRTPPTGWIKAIRLAIGMSSQQLGNKLSITRQAIQDMENREKDGSITLKSLNQVAKVLNMQLVYGFIPIDGSIEKMIENRARDLATEIVMRASNSMRLEDQENTKERIENAIKERTESLVREMPKVLWD